MKTYKPLAPILFALFFSLSAWAQNKTADELIQEGVKLNDAGNYTEAIAKYNEALKVDPGSLHADFEMGYTLFASGKGKDAIPYLQKVVQGQTNMTAGAYDLLGSIYDDDKQFDKAVEMYNAGIKADPKYQRLYYNLALCDVRQQKYAEAEANAIEAIKLTPNHASSQLVYAVSCAKEGKRLPALMGYANFLLLETNTKRTTDAYAALKEILNGGVTKKDDKNTTINLSMQKDGDAELNAAELGISLAVINANDGEKKNQPQVDILQSELKTIFTMTGELSAKKKSKDFFWNFYADFFYKLAKSNNMPAFTRIISLAGNRDENLKWLQDNKAALTDFQTWTKATSRTF